MTKLSPFEAMPPDGAPMLSLATAIVEPQMHAAATAHPGEAIEAIRTLLNDFEPAGVRKIVRPMRIHRYRHG